MSELLRVIVELQSKLNPSTLASTIVKYDNFRSQESGVFINKLLEEESLEEQTRTDLFTQCIRCAIHLERFDLAIMLLNAYPATAIDNAE